MKYLYITLVLSVTCNIGWSLLPSSNIEQHYHLLHQQQKIQKLQQQLHFLKHKHGQDNLNNPTNIVVLLPNPEIDDFEYVPTVQGYRLSFKRPDGRKHEENAFISGLRMDEYSRLDSKNTGLTALGVGGRPKMALKNRKLSPGSLKSLAG